MAIDSHSTASWRWPLTLLLLATLILVAIVGVPLLYVQFALTKLSGLADGLTQSYSDVTDRWGFTTESIDRLTVQRTRFSAKHQRTKNLVWGYMSDLVVEAEVDVAIDFTVSTARDDWKLESRKGKQGNIRLRVTAPELQADLSDIHVTFRHGTTKDGSLWFDKTHATNELLKQLNETYYPGEAARLKAEVSVREAARKRVRKFIYDWVIRNAQSDAVFSAIELEDISVVFADESAE